MEFHTRDAAVMGIAQAIALAPGVSRSGVTISAGRWLRFDRESATRLSFLMAIPITGGATLYKGAELAATASPAASAAPSSGASSRRGSAASSPIAFLLKFVQTHTFRPFVIYRVVLGIAVIIIFATGIR